MCVYRIAMKPIYAINISITKIFLKKYFYIVHCVKIHFRGSPSKEKKRQVFFDVSTLMAQLDAV